MGVDDRPDLAVLRDTPQRRKKMADLRAEGGQRKRDAMVALLRDGYAIKDAWPIAGWGNAGSYFRARHDHKDFAAACDEAKSHARSQHLEGSTDAPMEFQDFVRRYFPDRRPHLKHQIMIAAALENLRPREVAMFLLWPEAGKTATLEDYICRKLAYSPKERFRYVSEAQDLAKRVVGTVQRRFTETSEYAPFIDKYGPFYQKGQERQGKPWTTEQISIWNNPGTERDRNLVASSWTSSVYGSRIDTLILDDLQSQRNYNQAEEIFRRITGTFFNRGAEMRTLIIGTRIGPGDFYERMLDAGLITRKIVMPAADANGDPKIPEWWDRDIFHDGGPCCMGFRLETCPRDHSKLTPREFMELMRHQSREDTWWSSYMQEPRASTLSTFASYLDGCLDLDRVYGTLTPV